MSVPEINVNIFSDSWNDFWEKTKTQQDFSTETQLRKKDESVFPVEIKHNYFEFEGREYSCSFVRDITERKKAEENLQKAMNELEKLKNKLEEEKVYLQEEIELDHHYSEIIGKSDNIKQVLKQVEQVASTDSNVLILGETGTGKEMIARIVHNLSDRKERALVKVNCAALPANLIESELFGHERGAFTGAHARKLGRFELADNGTIFLDEIGDLPLELQAKLLRVLQEGEFERLGNSKTIKVDTRLIAATNRNLEELVKEGKFREDLYYRLNVFPIINPPLRERKEDIPILVSYFCEKFSSKIGKKIEGIPNKTMIFLRDYYWPGNIRELQNIIERAVIISKGSKLELGEWFDKEKEKPKQGMEIFSLDDLQRDHIEKVMDMTNGKIRGEDGAANILGIKPTTLEARIKKLGIVRA